MKKAVKDCIFETNCDTVIDVTVAKIINIDDLDEPNTIDTKSVNKNQNTEVQIHPDIAGINFKSRADQTPSALYAKQELAIN